MKFFELSRCRVLPIYAPSSSVWAWLVSPHVCPSSIEMWSNDSVLEFISLYETEPIIWNPKDSNYKNRDMVHDAWKRIQTNLSENFSIAELKKKKDSLMATFRKIVLKVKASKMMEEEFRSDWFAYDVMNKFLHDVYLPNATTDSKDFHVSADFDNDEMPDDKSILNDPERNGSVDVLSQQTHYKQIVYERSPKCQSNQSNSDKYNNKGIKRRIDDVHQPVSELPFTSQIQAQSVPCVHENEAFGKYVISALNRLPQREAILAQNEIQSILTRYRLDMLSTPLGAYTSPNSN